jgi:RNA polymerase sigma-70 factor (ECF subfamily)
MPIVDTSISVKISPNNQETYEEDLIRRIQSGERDLFYELVRPYERRVYAAAFAILHNPADAEDASQEAILKAFAHLHQFRSESRFSTWLIQIAINEARMRLRREHHEIMRPLEEQQDEEGTYTPREFSDWRELPSEALERVEVRDLLLEALASLGEKYRKIFVLRDVNHLSIEEVAETLGISRGSVKTRLLRARLMLRDLLAAKLSGGLFSRESFQKGNKPW